MPSTAIEAIREQIRREERATGLHGDGHVTDAAIRRRRAQIAVVAVVVLLGLVLTTLANDLWTEFKRSSSIVDVDTARLAMLVFSVAFVAYALEKETHLRRLSSLGIEARQLDYELARRMLSSAALAEAQRVVSSSLELEVVLRTALQQGAAMVEAASASLSLLTDDGELLEAACLDSEPGQRVADAILLQVALAREPMLVSGPVPLELGSGLAPSARTTSVICAPLEHAGALLGVITFGAAPTERFGEDAFDLVRRFVPGVAAAVSRARRYEAAVSLIDTRDDPLTEEVRSVSLAIRSAAEELRSDPPAPRRDELLDALEAGARRLLVAAG
ncbi:MAG: GAF domain-containing protein [Actinobacteria bacterium]|nr:GAF domain-containing protein [Actinomycetota bacterium]